jgi:hypothetical protein
MGIDRDEIRQSVEIILDTVETSERAKQAKSDDLAQLDAFIYKSAFIFLACVAGPAIGRVLERFRDGAPLGEVPAKKLGAWKNLVNDQFVANRVGVNKALALLLSDLAPALGSFPAGPVAGDLVGAIKGNSPRTLVAPFRHRGEKDGTFHWETARKRLALAIYFEAGRSGRKLDTVEDEIVPDIGKDAREAIRGTVPAARRRAVREAGTKGMQTPDALQASKDLANKESLARIVKEATKHTRVK